MTSHHNSWRSISTLSSHLCLGLPGDFLPSGLPIKTLLMPLLSPIRVTCPAHLTLHDSITRTILGEECRSLSSSLFSFFHSPVIVLLKPKYSPQHPILKNPQAYFPPSVSTTKHKTTGKIIDLCILIFKFLDNKVEDKRFCTECYITGTLKVRILSWRGYYRMGHVEKEFWV